MLDLGFVSAILPNKTLWEVLDFAQQQQFACVEIMCWPSSNADTRRYAGVSHIAVDNLSHDELVALKAQLTLHPVKISALGYYPNPMDPNEDQALFYREHIKKIIRAAAVLGISRVNTFIGRDYTKNVNYNIGKFTEVWPEIIGLADSLNIKIGIENCPMFFTDDEWPGGKNLMTTPKIWDQLFSIIPSKNFGLNYDPSHMVFQMMDYTYPIYHYAEKLHHVHLKDVKVYPEKLNRVGILANPLEYHSPKIPGLGDIHWGKFISALNDVRYRGPIVIEVEDKAYEGSDEDIEKAILSARNHIKQYLP
ncbi:sugar phosphate isomerase/epimerase family protein [Aquirufa aurantiipilula]|uniref:Sugar phosphate isomerase/epimerase n=1 Tax=Aquirufa aurantiipilula TaxID=2696561 RepID=A0ABT6BKU6_9BACT|nr:sugar phosphate isomerase/epimerase family protein [Aquirufa aurantiipilula]MDF5691096.1 sugar phosphate isomerase/epimerase [Aquirufa aurantiipilula]